VVKIGNYRERGGFLYNVDFAVFIDYLHLRFIAMGGNSPLIFKEGLGVVLRMTYFALRSGLPRLTAAEGLLPFS